MAGFSTRRLGYLQVGFSQPGSYWKQLQDQRARQRERREQYEAMSAQASNTLLGAGNDQMLAAGDLAAKAALKRIQDQTAAKVAENQANEAKNRSVYVNKEPATSIDAGKTSINFNSDTLTLSDGTTIDIKTGVKKVNLTA